MTTDDGDSEPVKEDVSDGKIDEATAKKYINAAKKAISDAMWTFEVSNDTTSTDILKMAMDAADNNDVIITLDKANFKNCQIVEHGKRHRFRNSHAQVRYR
ncbi:MAG: hypothetical protein L6V93_14075 [Clostridiales bacterium]|nr:MAG: hypothetical protein L6V93_14075 [Clostridiales bacterium]